MKLTSIHKKLTYTQIIVLSFFVIILVGTTLLCFPFSSRTNEWTPFLDSMFTATSATCVTGLIVYDTYLHWSLFGQVVIICLIQIGGLGVMTCIALIALFLKKRISIAERRLLMQSAGALQMSGIVKLMRRILMGTVIIEGTGVVIFSLVFVPKMGFAEGVWNAIFHSISAFCNAGFDLMGKYGAFSSLANTEYAFHPVVNLTIMALIVIGGIGFIVWTDFVRHGFHLSRYETHSKIVLTVTATLLVLGTVLFYIFEYNHSLAGLTTWQKILASAFHSVTPRTAGFNTVFLNKLSNSGALLTTILMFIGGSPGSTAGGIKTTTFMVVLVGAFASAKGLGGRSTSFKRRVDEETIIRASAITTIYAIAVLTAVLIISAIEPFSFMQILFETVSAIGTVGLTMGITPQLTPLSHSILIFLMFAGRVGGLSLMLVLAEQRRSIPIDRPTAKLLIG